MRFRQSPSRAARTYARLAVTLVAVLAGGTGCGGQALRSNGSASPLVITSTDIERIHVTTAYEAIERLRPEFLRGRGAQSVRDPRPQLPLVYINGMQAGELDVLHRVQALEVLEIRYLSPSDATTRYGTGHAGGVIEIRLHADQP